MHDAALERRSGDRAGKGDDHASAGFVVESKARAAKSASSYALADVKALVKGREEARERRELKAHDLSHGETDCGVASRWYSGSID